MRGWTLIMTLFSAGSAILHIRAEYTGPPYQIYIFKPLTMVFILLIALGWAKKSLSFYAYMILVGLLFSIAGDCFLMLPSDLFLQGLASFLIAHLFYIFAFIRHTRFKSSLWAPLAFALFGLLIFSFLSSDLGEMKMPVLAYIAVILFMGWRAWERWNQTRQQGALLASLGAILFIVSDSVLAINRFKGHFEMGRALNLGTYFAAQWLIALSIKQGGSTDKEISSGELPEFGKQKYQKGCICRPEGKTP